MLKNNSESLLKIIDEKVLGIIWLTKNQLDLSHPKLKDLNYIFDGLIAEYIESNSKKNNSRTNLFFNKNFNQKIFLIQTELKSNIETELVEQLNLIKIQKTEFAYKILIINETDFKIKGNLIASFPHLEFGDI